MKTVFNLVIFCIFLSVCSCSASNALSARDVEVKITDSNVGFSNRIVSVVSEIWRKEKKGNWPGLQKISETRSASYKLGLISSISKIRKHSKYEDSNIVIEFSSEKEDGFLTLTIIFDGAGGYSYEFYEAIP